TLVFSYYLSVFSFSFSFNPTAPTQIYTLSLHDALPIAVRPFTAGRLIVVVGCGGDRDKGKRPVMGAIAAQKAGIPIVTSDNPRTEDPERILDDIESGMGNVKHERIEDRRAAIARALEL